MLQEPLQSARVVASSPVQGVQRNRRYTDDVEFNDANVSSNESSKNPFDPKGEHVMLKSFIEQHKDIKD